MGKLIGKLYETKDYSKFKFLKGNRAIKEKRSLIESIEKSGILVPIDVNEKFEIIDGQTRFLIARKLNKSIPYIISKGLNLDDVIELNSTIKTWKIGDFIRKYSMDGMNEYKKLQFIVKKYKNISPFSLISLAMGNKHYDGNSQELVKTGQFSFYNYKEFIRLLDSYGNFCEELNLRSSQQTFFAYVELFIVKDFDYYRLINGFKIKTKNVIEGIFHQGVVLEEFLKAYNYKLHRNSNKAIKYEIEIDGKPVIRDIQSMFLIKEIKNG